jgi:tetratricopeptide (TPR) repeat protein
MERGVSATVAGQSWSTRLAIGREVLGDRGRTLEDLASIAPWLVDTVERAALARTLRQLPDAAISSDSRLAFAIGYTDLIDGACDSGARWLVRAEAALRPDDRVLAARIAFELGSLYVGRSYATPAEVLLLDQERDADPPFGDLLHLRALTAEAMGDHRQAAVLYRQTLASDVRVLTPATKVLATINLAASCTQCDPHEALALTELAIALIAGHELDYRLRPPALNIMGYALICLGQLAAARDQLATAAEEARACSYRRIELYASFNLAIIEELEGASDNARARLGDVYDRARKTFPELAGWARIRSIWMSWLVGDVEVAAQALAESRADLRSMRYAEALLCLQALVDVSHGRLSEALATFEALRRAASLRGDAATELALLLRVLHLTRTQTTPTRTQRYARAALDILAASTVRLSPNWWSAEIVRTFCEAVTDPLRLVLVAPALEPMAHRAAPEVTLRDDGVAVVAGCDAMPDWHVGRTGSHVLRRLFALLVQRWPRTIPRDALADELWPDSDGDTAVRNLYAATNDLRKVLVNLPGVRLQVDGTGYGLELAPNVRIAEHGKLPRRSHLVGSSS